MTENGVRRVREISANILTLEYWAPHSSPWFSAVTSHTLVTMDIYHNLSWYWSMSYSLCQDKQESISAAVFCCLPEMQPRLHFLPRKSRKSCCAAPALGSHTPLSSKDSLFTWPLAAPVVANRHWQLEWRCWTSASLVRRNELKSRAMSCPLRDSASLQAVTAKIASPQPHCLEGPYFIWNKNLVFSFDF